MVRAGQTVSQVVLHMGVAFGVMYALTGSVAFGGIAALIEPLCNVALLPLHDRLWARIRAEYERRRTGSAGQVQSILLSRSLPQARLQQLASVRRS